MPPTNKKSLIQIPSATHNPAFTPCSILTCTNANKIGPTNILKAKPNNMPFQRYSTNEWRMENGEWRMAGVSCSARR